MPTWAEAMTFLLSAWAFLRKVPLWLYGAAGAALGLLLVWVRGKAAGRSQRQAEEQERAIEQADTRKEVEDDIARTDPGGNRDRLGEWVPRHRSDD